jgi:hypothetical protein
MESAMRIISILAVVCAVTLVSPAIAAPNDPAGSPAAKAPEAPIGHRQPSLRDVDQARASKRDNRDSDYGLTEEERKLEGDLRSKLQICRRC